VMNGYWAMIGLASAVLCCKRESSPAEVTEKPAPEVLFEPDEKPAGRSRCALAEGEQPLPVRSEPRLGVDPDETESPFAVELGNAVAMTEGFAVGFLRPGKQTTSWIMVTDGRGRSRSFDLGPVHGPVGPPRLFAHGSALLVAMMDGDAAGGTLRVGRIAAPFAAGPVVWGPEVSEGRDASSAFSLAANGGTALLVWDREDSKSAISRVERLIFDAVTLAVRAPPAPLGDPGEDADQPLLITRPGGFWLVWSSYRRRPKDSFAGEAETRGLVDEPPAKLRVVTLDDKAQPTAPPIDIGEFRLHGSDIALGSGGSLMLAVQSGDTAEDERAITVLHVGLDGHVTRTKTEHPDLVAAAPLLVHSPTAPGLWLTARGKDGGTLLGTLSDDSVARLEPEKELRMREPLVAGTLGWLVAEPAGADVRLRLFRCAEEPQPDVPGTGPVKPPTSAPTDGTGRH